MVTQRQGIASDTIDTMPLETFEAYRDHGDPALRLEIGFAEAERVLEILGELDLDLDAVTDKLESEGVQKFIAAHDRLLLAITDRCAQAVSRVRSP
jgi:transaldolase